MRTGLQIAIGSLAGVIAAGLAVVLFLATSDFLVMFAATPCVLGLAGVVLVHEAAEVLVILNGVRAARRPAEPIATPAA